MATVGVKGLNRRLQYFDFSKTSHDGIVFSLTSINQSISTNHLHKIDQWLTNKVKNNKTKIKPNE